MAAILPKREKRSWALGSCLFLSGLEVFLLGQRVKLRES